MGSILKYKDKYFSILGDSLSTFKGVSEPSFAYFYDETKKLEADVITVSDTWWGMVIDYLNAKVLVNNSFSGSTVSYSPLYECESYGCSKERTSSLDKNGVEPDVIMIYLGTNDWGAGFKLKPTFLDKEKSLSTFSTAYEEMLLNFAKMIRGEVGYVVELETEARIHRCLLTACGIDCDYKGNIKI